MYYTHINRGIIDSNSKHGTSRPAVRFQKGKYGKATYAFEIKLPIDSVIIYSPHEPLLPCGARLVIKSEQKPEIIR